VSNSASLLLPGSNLTNLLVLSRHHINGLAFARQMWAAWLISCLLTIALLAVAFPLEQAHGPEGEPPHLRLGLGAGSALLAAALVVILPDAALPVLAVGTGAIILRRQRPEIDARVLPLLFALTVALGTLARAWNGPAQLLDHTGRWSTAALAALSANLVNNLPATVLLSAQAPPHPRALLLGLDLGPNLAVTGSLSAYLWLQAAKTVQARPSIRTYSGLGLVLVPITLAATVGTLLTR
jgi:arsenical pump membrane protein